MYRWIVLVVLSVHSDRSCYSWCWFVLPERYKYWVNKLIDSFKSYDTRTRVGVLIQCFIACACDIHSTFKDLIVAERARPCTCSSGRRVTDWLRCLGAVRADHFGAKWWAQLLFEEALWRGEELQRPLFSPSKTRSVECRATVFLVAWHTGKESVKGTLFPRLINIVVVRRQEDVGLLRTDCPPLTLSWSSGLRILS